MIGKVGSCIPSLQEVRADTRRSVQSAQKIEMRPSLTLDREWGERCSTAARRE